MPKYTVFCSEKNRMGTTWINCVEAENPDAAWINGRAMCARDWELEDPSELHVLGVAEGEVKILEWHD